MHLITALRSLRTEGVEPRRYLDVLDPDHRQQVDHPPCVGTKSGHVRVSAAHVGDRGRRRRRVAAVGRRRPRDRRRHVHRLIDRQVL